MSTVHHLPPRTALYLPASNPRAIEKARGLEVDLVILDLEDAVKAADKDTAREAARDCAPFEGKLFAIRVNEETSDHWSKDLKAVRKSAADYIVVPKVEKPETIVNAGAYGGAPVLAMIETAAGVMNVGQIASTSGWGYEMAGLIAGTNDLAASLKLPPAAGRPQMQIALQLIVLAARARQIWALDGVFNRLDDPEGLAAECAEGRLLGFDGKTLIHPNQIEIARVAFSPSEAELENARALIAAASGGAERYNDAMIEDLHVAQAKALLERAARQAPPATP